MVVLRTLNERSMRRYERHESLGILELSRIVKRSVEYQRIETFKPIENKDQP